MIFRSAIGCTLACLALAPPAVRADGLTAAAREAERSAAAAAATRERAASAAVKGAPPATRTPPAGAPQPGRAGVGASLAPTRPPADAPAPVLLLANEGRPGPLRGMVTVRVDARAHADLAFVRLRVLGREDFLCNAGLTVRPWDTRALPDGNYTLVAEAFASHYLIARSRPVVVEIRNQSD